MPESLDVIAERIFQLAMRNAPRLGKVGVGPVLTVVRDPATGNIYVGLNTGTPNQLADVLQKNMAAHHANIQAGKVKITRTDPAARDAGHAEANALNAAVRDREQLLGRKMTQFDLQAFELHNVWLTGSRTGSPAARCEHCQGITQGVRITHSVYVAEGGVIARAGTGGAVVPAGKSKPNYVNGGAIAAGEIDVAQRGSATRAGRTTPAQVTTTSGSIGGRSPGGAGGGSAGFTVAGLLTGPALLAGAALRQHLYRWVAERNREKWSAQQRDMIIDAIEGHVFWFNLYEIQPRSRDIQQVKAAGRRVKFRIDVDTEWVNTEFGPAQISAKVVWYAVLFEGDADVQWPVWQPSYGAIKTLFNAPRVTRKRYTLYAEL